MRENRRNPALTRYDWRVREVTYRAGDALFSEGDYSTDAYILRRGRVEVYVTRRGGDRRLAVLHEGAVFGELALITDQVRTASVRALDDAQLLAIDQDGFLELWRHHPEALLPLLRVIFERVRDIVSLANELSLEESNRAIGRCFLIDRGTRTGTFVNGERVGGARAPRGWSWRKAAPKWPSAVPAAPIASA